MKRTIITLMAAACLMGCLNRNRPDGSVPRDEDQLLQRDVTGVETDDPHTAYNSLDYTGTYKGVLPCADCEGIETTLKLEDDGTYELATRYIGGKSTGEVYYDRGTYKWDGDGTRIVLDRDGKPLFRYFVGENVLWHLDADGNRIEGDHADYYKLVKQS